MVKIIREEMEILQAMLQLLSLSLYGLVSEIMQKLTKINFIGDDELWIGDNVIWL